MPPKSRDESSGCEVLKYVTLTGNYNVLGIVCNRIELANGRANHAASSVFKADTLVLNGTRIIVNGSYIMPVNSGVVVGWEVE